MYSFHHLYIIVIILIPFQFIKCIEISELDKNFYNITFHPEELYELNIKQNVECDIVNKELYKYTDHNFNEPLLKQTIANPGKFYFN